jgi:hypothetical protein
MVAMLLIGAAAVPIGNWVRRPPRAVPVQVSGTVTLDGAPLSDAHVSFLDSTGGEFSAPLTNAAGRFNVPVYHIPPRGEVGLLPGFYHVLVRKCTPGVAVLASTGEPLDPNIAGSFAIKYIEEPRSLIPERYGDPKRSKLVAEVFADEPNSFAFGLLTP